MGRQIAELGMPLAVLMLGSAAAALPAAAAEKTALPPRAQEAAPVAGTDKPLVMLVCHEVQSGRRVGHARAPELACVTRWTVG